MGQSFENNSQSICILTVKKGDQFAFCVEDKSFMKLRVGGDIGVTFDRIFVRVDPSFKLEVHIDTDEGNACGFTQDTPCELIK